MKNARSCNLDLGNRAHELLELIQEDYSRRVRLMTMTRERLDSFARIYDRCIVGTIIQVLGGDADTFEARLAEKGLLGLFNRTDWLHDLPSDLVRGIINIPSDDIAAYQISLTELRKSTSLKTMLDRNPGFNEWFRSEQLLLRARWQELIEIMGNDFAGAFKSPLLARTFRWAFMHWFVRITMLRDQA